MLFRQGYFCPIIDGIEEYYEIDNIQVVPRKDVFPPSQTDLYKDQPDPYYVFTLKNRKKLHRKIDSAAVGNRVFRYARLSELSSSQSINDFNREAQEGD